MIITLAGRIGSGKDTVAEMLVEQHGFVRDSFAGTLKDAIAAIFSWDREMLEGKTPEARAWREQVDTWWANKLGTPHLTPRWVLQNFGTEVMRTHFHTDIWVASLERKLMSVGNQNIVISDARFINELAMLTNLGSKTVCVSRGEHPTWYKIAEVVNRRSDHNASWHKYKTLLDSYKIHTSETAWAGYDFDVQIENNGTLEDLQNTVKRLVRT